jgi:gamma-glutamyltranspeptidase/glutathione hydrolase
MLVNHGITCETGIPPLSAHTVTVPGAAAGWVDTVEAFGSGKVTEIVLTYFVHCNVLV